MLADITIDGMVEDEFRHAIETLLREGNADQAARWLKSRLQAVCGDGRPLPERFLTVSSADVTVTGWEDIASRLKRLDAAGSPVTAIGIDLSDPGHVGLVPDPSGLMPPHIETHFYTDEAWPFSRSDRAELLKGYEGGTAHWSGRFADVDDTIAIEGLDDLYGAVFALEHRCRAPGNANDTEHRAYMLGASYVAVLAHLAVREATLRQGLPRPLAVLVGSNESYPFFDAPVNAASDVVVAAPPSPSGPEDVYEESPADRPGLVELRELTEPDADPGQEPEAWHLPPPPDHVTGTELRRRLVTEESIAELEAARKPSLLQRLFRRK